MNKECMKDKHIWNSGLKCGDEDFLLPVPIPGYALTVIEWAVIEEYAFPFRVVDHYPDPIDYENQIIQLGQYKLIPMPPEPRLACPFGDEGNLETYQAAALRQANDAGFLKRFPKLVGAITNTLNSKEMTQMKIELTLHECQTVMQMLDMVLWDDDVCDECLETANGVMSKLATALIAGGEHGTNVVG